MQDPAVVGMALIVIALVVLGGVKVLRTDPHVEYNGRQYVDPGTVPASRLRDTPLRDTGVDRRGMDVLVPDSPGSSGDPTWIVLRRDDGRYDVYNLSGGP